MKPNYFRLAYIVMMGIFVFWACSKNDYRRNNYIIPNRTSELKDWAKIHKAPIAIYVTPDTDSSLKTREKLSATWTSLDSFDYQNARYFVIPFKGNVALATVQYFLVIKKLSTGTYEAALQTILKNQNIPINGNFGATRNGIVQLFQDIKTKNFVSVYTKFSSDSTYSPLSRFTDTKGYSYKLHYPISQVDNERISSNRNASNYSTKQHSISADAISLAALSSSGGLSCITVTTPGYCYDVEGDDAVYCVSGSKSTTCIDLGDVADIGDNSGGDGGSGGSSGGRRLSTNER